MSLTHFAFVVVPASGHIAPLVAVSRELVGRGHRATFLHLAEVGPSIEAHGVEFAALRTSKPSTIRLEDALGRAARVRGLRGIRAVIRDFAVSSAILCESLPDALRHLDIDCIVSDSIEPASGLVAHHLGLPHVSVAAALPLNWEPGEASPFLGWRYRNTRWRRNVNVAVQWVAERVQRPIHDVLESYAREWNLPVRRRVQDWASGFAQIAQLPPSLDFPREALIGCFHYCGPLRSPAPEVRRRFRHGRRRAFASLGSLQGHRAEVFEWIADATEALDMDLTIAHGGRLSDADVARLSRRAKVHAFVDYASALGESDVAVMHGGLNGVLDTLAQGVPLVVVPLAYEQGAIAARVERTGAGRVCRPMARRGQLAAAIRAVLDNPAYAEAGARIRDEIAAAGGAILAADVIEQVARTRAPCLNAATIAAYPALAEYALASAPSWAQAVPLDEIVH